MLFRAQAAAQTHGYAGRPSDSGVSDYLATLHLHRSDSGDRSDGDSINGDRTHSRIQSMKVALIKENLHIGGKRNSSRVSRVLDPAILQDIYKRQSSFEHKSGSDRSEQSHQGQTRPGRLSSVDIIVAKANASSKCLHSQCRHLCLLLYSSGLSLLQEDKRKELFGGVRAFYHVHRIFFNRLLKIFWIVFYYIVGILFFVHEERDNDAPSNNFGQPWSPLSAVYFITQTVSTVGYGNLVPSTDSGRVFIVFYALVGILLVFSIVNEITYALFISSLKKTKKVKQKKKKLKIVVRKTVEVFLWFVLLFALILVGSTVIYSNEDGCGTFGSYNEAFYFSAITATGIGYGDFTLQRDSSIVFNIFYILVSVSLTATAMEKAATLSMRIEQAEVEQELDHLQLTASLLENIKFYVDKDKVSKSDYILFMLLYAGLVDHHRDIEPWIDRFDEVDEDNDGEIDDEDVRRFTAAQLRRKIAQGGGPSALGVERRKTTSMVMAILHEVGDTLLDLSHLKSKPADASAASSALDEDLEAELAQAVQAEELATTSPLAFRSQAVAAAPAAFEDGFQATAGAGGLKSLPEQQLARIEQSQAARQIKMSLIKRPSLVPRDTGDPSKHRVGTAAAALEEEGSSICSPGRSVRFAALDAAPECSTGDVVRASAAEADEASAADEGPLGGERASVAINTGRAGALLIAGSDYCDEGETSTRAL